MSAISPIRYRELCGADLQRAVVFASQLGLHGVYLGNALLASRDCGADEDPTGGLLGCDDSSGELSELAWFGKRGNLMLGRGGTALGGPDGLVTAIAAQRSPWRIALGPDDVIDELARRDERPRLVHRRQLYYGFQAGDVAVERCRDDVRLAQRQDLRALVDAALELNASDLNVAQWRVHRGWLRDSVRRRIREGRTFVVGPLGAPWCKLDLGSEGPAGVVLEGVYTLPGHRGRGLASALVASVGARLVADHPVVCLHVAASNESARRAYAAAGMGERDSCRLLLLG